MKRTIQSISSLPHPMIAAGKNLVLWIDASDFETITLNGSDVSQWRDKSGNGNHANQTIASRQPLYATNAVNGKSVVRLNGILDNFLITHSSTLNLSNTCSIFAAFNKTNVAGEEYLFQKGGASVVGGPPAIRFHADTFNFDSPGWGVDFDKTSFPTGSFIINTVVRDTGSYLVFNIDRVATTPTTFLDKAFSNNTSNLHIGSNTGETGNFFQGDIGEILIFNSRLSVYQTFLVENYLANKWGR